MKAIKLNFIPYEFSGITGTVVGKDKRSDTKVHGYVSNNGGGNISSTTVISDDIFLLDKNGKEHSFQLLNFDIACRNDNILSVLSSHPFGRKSGRYFAVINHSTGKIFYHQYRVKALCAPNKYALGAIFIILSFFLFAYSYNGSGLPKIGVLLIAVIAFYIIMEKINQRKLEAAIVPSDYLEAQPQL